MWTSGKSDPIVANTKSDPIVYSQHMWTQKRSRSSIYQYFHLFILSLISTSYNLIYFKERLIYFWRNCCFMWMNLCVNYIIHHLVMLYYILLLYIYAYHVWLYVDLTLSMWVNAGDPRECVLRQFAALWAVVAHIKLFFCF